MKYHLSHIRQLFIFAFVSIAMLLYGCSQPDTFTDKDFIGKWKSSRSTNPLYLNINGEWEIKNEEGLILQFGVWKYKNRKITWSYKQGNQVLHDVNPVLSSATKEFKVQERDGAITTFIRLE